MLIDRFSRSARTPCVVRKTNTPQRLLGAPFVLALVLGASGEHTQKASRTDVGFGKIQGADLEGGSVVDSATTKPGAGSRTGGGHLRGSTRLHVDLNATGANDGTNWDDAYTQMQDALAHAEESAGIVSEIWVAAETYRPDQGAEQTPGDRDATFQLIDGVAIYGGFAGDETSLDQRDIEANETILSGDLLGDDTPVACTDDSPDCDANGGRCLDSGFCTVPNSNGENSYHVATGSWTDATAVLDGFTITAGSANGTYPDNVGGGLFVTAGSPTLTQCTFSANWAESNGGGMTATNNGNPTITGCTFVENATGFGGGGMQITISSEPTLTDCVFIANSTGNRGGGLGNDGGSSPVLNDCVFSGNSAGYNGGGMYNINSSNPTLTGCTFSGNTSGSGGGGMQNLNGSSPILVECMFVGNSASQGGGMLNFNGCNPALIGCTLTGNEANSAGGMLNMNSSPIVINCRFSGNIAASGSGGGISNSSASEPSLTNCVFTGNSASGSGGAISSAGDGFPTLTNCTLYGNTAGSGGGIYLYSTAAGTTVNNCIVWGNTPGQVVGGAPTVTYSNVQDGFAGTGNIDADPLFTDPDGEDDTIGTADDNVRLFPGSPSIDSANNDEMPSDAYDLDDDGDTGEPTPLDLDGRPRFVDDPATDPDTGNGTPPIVDMGACEYLPPLYVDATATGAEDGSSWEDAYVYLQDALDHAEGAGGEVGQIWVAAETYRPDQGTEQTPGDREATFQLLDGVAVYGGFAGDETSLDQRDVEANETILSGDLGGDDEAVSCSQDSPDCDSLGGLCIDGFCIVKQNNSENSLHIVTGSSTDATAALDGFTIAGGNADGTDPDDRGAGMFNSEGSPTVSNCTFRGNSAYRGGGMYNWSGSSPAVTNCTFVGNSAVGSFAYGGGMFNYLNSSPTVAECTFTGNGSAYNGGGMATVYDSSPTVTNCTFSGNSAPLNSGGGMHTSGGSPTVTGCTFSGNSAYAGGGMLNYSTNPTVANCTFSGNSSVYGGSGMRNNSASPTVTNCTFSGNTGNSGGGMHNSSGAPTVTNCTFSGNSVTNSGGGMVNSTSSSPTVTNCTFSGNSANFGGGMHNSGNSSPTVDNSILWGNVDDADGDDGGPFMDESAQIHTGSGTPVVNYSLVMGGWSGAGGTGIVSSDPLFVDAEGADNIPGTEDDDVRLRPGSPAIDAADTTALPPDSLDLDGDGDTSEWISLDVGGSPRVLDDPATVDTGVPGSAVVDMGASEFFADCNGNTIPDVCDLDCGVPDGPCDLPGCGGSEDYDGNGAPDECDPDCNENGVPDACDIDCDTGDCIDHPLGCGVSEDYDGNDAPDECDPDCDSDGVPDACELDCGVGDCASHPGGCGGSEDCQPNGIPDECDMADCTPEHPDYPDCNDCNDNGIPDVCDIAECSPEHPDYPGCDDCNVNDIPDECDIEACTPKHPDYPGCLDVDPIDGVPDQCTGFTGGCAPSPNWTCGDNWPLGGGYPDNEDSVPDRRVTLAGVEVFLDETIVTDSLRVLTGATLSVTQTGVAGDLTLVAPGGLFLRGDFLTGNGRVIDVAAGRFEIAAGGLFTHDPTAGAADEAISAGGVLLGPGIPCPPACPPVDGGTMNLEGTMTLDVLGDLVLNGPEVDQGRTTPRMGGINPPPKLSVKDLTEVVTQGDFVIRGSVFLSHSTTSSTTLGGDFDNQGTDPVGFRWIGGGLLLNGEAHRFEAAGRDLGPIPGGFENNFAMTTVEAAPDSNVVFSDTFDNDLQGQSPCSEALYVQTLVLGDESTITIDDCNIYYGTLVDNGATIVIPPGSCGGLLQATLPTVCTEDADCDDGESCTADGCDPGSPQAELDGCVHEYQQRLLADLVSDFCPPDCPQPNIDDILCLLDDFGDGPAVSGCAGLEPPGSTDLAPCGGNGIIDMSDVLFMLGAYAQSFSCPHPCP